jgi:hypothetical protein
MTNEALGPAPPRRREHSEFTVDPGSPCPPIDRKRLVSEFGACHMEPLDEWQWGASRITSEACEVGLPWMVGECMP